MKNKFIAAGLALLVMALVGCSYGGSEADKREQQISNDLAAGYTINQPIPTAEWSQIRQTLIEIQTMQTDATATFSYFFAPGKEDGLPIFQCPSIGDPVPSSFQLTNPEKTQKYNGGRYVLPQMEPTGVFSGDTTATNVLCVDAQGRGFKVYWEGQVMSTTTELSFGDAVVGTISNGAEPTAEFTVENDPATENNSTTGDDEDE